MTTKELYQSAKNATEFPSFLLFYTYKNKDDVVQLGSSIPLSKQDEDGANISKMEKIERDTENFMFWNHDPKSSKWFEENSKAIQEQFIKYILGVNGFGPKISKN
jgi:hypothetical protein